MECFSWREAHEDKENVLFSFSIRQNEKEQGEKGFPCRINPLKRDSLNSWSEC